MCDLSVGVVARSGDPPQHEVRRQRLITPTANTVKDFHNANQPKLDILAIVFWLLARAMCF
jgi:hypothetical protein